MVDGADVVEVDVVVEEDPGTDDVVDDEPPGSVELGGVHGGRVVPVEAVVVVPDPLPRRPPIPEPAVVVVAAVVDVVAAQVAVPEASVATAALTAPV